MAKNVPSLVGERFGRWIVLDQAEKDKSGEIQYLCRCDCGNGACTGDDERGGAGRCREEDPGNAPENDRDCGGQAGKGEGMTDWMAIAGTVVLVGWALLAGIRTATVVIRRRKK